MTANLESRRGFSLVELMVAIGILSFGMAAVGALLTASYSTDRHYAATRRAEALSTDLCERFKAGNLGDTSDTDRCKRKLVPSTVVGTKEQGRAGFQWPIDKCWNAERATGAQYYCWWETDVHKDADGMDTGYRKLDVLIYWGDKKPWSGFKCDRDHLDVDGYDYCKYKLKIVNYYKPSGS